MKQCRACGHKHVTSILHLDQVPIDVQRLVTQNQLDSKTTTEIEIYQCIRCGLVQSAVSLESTYYDDYLMSTTFSSQLTNYLNDLVIEFVNKYNLHNAHVVDIGCGDGAFMLPFAKQGISVVGIEPSERSRLAAQEKGLVVHAGYVSANSAIPGGPFDAFVCRQVLEHVDNIAEFLTGIRENLQPGAVGIIEVPRLEKALEDRRFYDFFPDHVNYFSLDTLSTTVSLHGFEVLESRPTMNDEYNIVIVCCRDVKNNVNDL
jgi:SAM-dependent methyltransferase